jgi:hypothetical protein
MSFSPPRSPVPLRRAGRRLAWLTALVAHAERSDAASAVREPEPDHARGAVPDLGWRVSSRDRKHGLDVVELPTSLPLEVLDWLFRTAAK